MSFSLASDTATQIARLSCLSVADLRDEWSRVFGAAPPKGARREYLLRAVTYRLQAGPHGGLPASLLRSLRKLCAEPGRTAATATPTRTLRPGARILREWKGAVHEVEVVDTGYRYGNETYKSLSVIARQITGTRWSGPAFFGLKQSEANHG
jgi:hypothetical protein